MTTGLTDREREYICHLIKERIKHIEAQLNSIEREVIVKDLNSLIQKIQTFSLSQQVTATDPSEERNQIHHTKPKETSILLDNQSKEFATTHKEILKESQKKSIKKQEQIPSSEIDQPKVKTIGEIKVVCEKCDKYMDLFKSLKSEYYRCRRFPRCNVTGDEKQVARALTEKIVTKRKNADTVKLYRYDENEEVVFVSEVTKEKGLLNSIDKGVWR